MAATCLLLAFVAPVAGAADQTDDVVRPDVWGGTASSRAVSVNLNRDALLPVPDVFNFIALDGLSSYGSSSQAARASILFPGNGAIIGPGLVCGTFGGQFPAQFKPILDTCLKYQYPLTVFADEFDPDSNTNGSLAIGKPTDDVSLDATTAKAHAAIDGANSDAVVQDLRVLGVPPFGPVALPGSDTLKLDTSVVDVDSATSRTDQRIVKGGLVTDAKVTLSGVKLIGGLVRIGTLVSESKVTDDAGGKRTADATFHATGVTVAGVPAQITNKGLVLGSPDNKTQIPPELTSAVSEILKTLSIKVSTLPTEETLNKGGQARASVGGIIVEFARDAEGLPLLPSPIGGQIDPNGVYTVTVQLGLTGVIGSAANFGVEGDVLDNVTDDLGGLGSDFSDGSFAFDDSGSFNNETGLGSPDALGMSGASNNTSPQRTALVRSLGDNFGGRLGFVYLALMFAVLALCIAPRLVVPARFPGNKR